MTTNTTNTEGGVMKVKGSRRLVARLGLALAVAAIAVPSAQAVTMNTSSESGGSVRQYADDLRAPLSEFSLPASNVRTDAASPQSSNPGANVLTDSASPRPVNVPSLALAPSVQTDAASSVKPVPSTNEELEVLLRSQFQNEPTQLASTDSGIDWSVPAIGSILGAIGLMLLIGVMFFNNRHHDRRGRLAAT